VALARVHRVVRDLPDLTAHDRYASALLLIGRILVDEAHVADLLGVCLLDEDPAAAVVDLAETCWDAVAARDSRAWR
jgi:hypothetical protein